MRVKQVYTPVLHLVEGLDTASAGKEAAGTVHYDAISLGILGQGLPQRRLQDVIPLGCLHRPSPQDPKILRVHQPGEVTDTKKKGEWTCFQGKALFYKVWFGITPFDIANLHMVVPRLT